MAEQLSTAQIAQYDENGYLLLERQIPEEWLAKLRAEISRFELEAAMLEQSNDRLDLEDSHTPEDPRLRRIKLPHTISDVVAELMTSDHVLGPCAGFDRTKSAASYD